MASALGSARFSSCFRNKTGDDQTSLCIYFFCKPSTKLLKYIEILLYLWLISGMFYRVMWHQIQTCHLTVYQTISLEIGLLSTSTMLFLHQHTHWRWILFLCSKIIPFFFGETAGQPTPGNMSQPQFPLIMLMGEIRITTFYIYEILWNHGDMSQYQLVSWSPDSWLPSTVSLGGS